MKAIYKSIALLFGAMSMFSSCEDFLTRDPQDSFLLKDYLADNDALEGYTKQIYGPLTWNGFDDKFSWCVGELYSGNVYHNFSDEGQFHFMSFTNTNAHIQNGYTSLYGVIAKCNHIINDVPAIAKENGLSEAILDKVLGEAHMFRGMAYFYLAEYWGASPIVLHNSDDIANDLANSVTKADRKSLYTLIEKDWKEAYDLLPGEAQRDCHVWKASAAGMLAKLYVTMASCQREIDEPGSYKCDDPKAYYKLGKKWATTCLDLCDVLDADYDRIFWPGTQSHEILFALCFEQGVYAQGCSRQIQFARSSHLAGGGPAYGGEKGLTTMLFNSYDAKDLRLKGTAYYNVYDEMYGSSTQYNDAKTFEDMKANKGHFYTLYDGSKYYYFLNPTKSIDEEERIFGNEPNSAIFNHCRKFIYSVKPQVSEFSINLTIPMLRVADVYLLRAEAEMGMENTRVKSACTAGIADVNKVRARAGLDPISKIAFCEPDSCKENGNKASFSFDKDGKTVEISASCDLYIPTYDLMMERRHEFALENQCWLDIKRLFYRDEKAARDYIKSQDRAYTYGQKFGTEIAIPQKKADFQRQDLIYKLSVKANKEDATYAVQTPEGVINIDKLQFFLPVPANVPNTANFATVKDYSEEIANGTYPY